MAATDPDPDELSEEQLDALTERVADRLDERLGDGELADSVTSRRNILRGLAGGGLAAALGLSATGSAAAGSNNVGTVGSNSEAVDVNVEDLDLDEQGSTPNQPAPGEVRVYAKSGSVYALPNGGSETQLGGSGGSQGTIELLMSPVSDTNTTAKDGTAETVDGKVYVLGGEDSNNAEIKTVQEYVPWQDTWNTLSDANYKASDMASAVASGTIYYFGGDSGFATSVKSTGKFTPGGSHGTIANYPEKIRNASAVEYNGSIYVSGGRQSSSTLKQFRRYDPGSDSYTNLSDMPFANNGHGMGVINGKIYVAGGITNAAKVAVYDVSGGSWTQKSDLPNSNTNPEAAVIDDNLILFGGGDLIQVFTPGGSWTQLRELKPNGEKEVAATENEVYATDGNTTIKYEIV